MSQPKSVSILYAYLFKYTKNKKKDLNQTFYLFYIDIQPLMWDVDEDTPHDTLEPTSENQQPNENENEDDLQLPDLFRTNVCDEGSADNDMMLDVMHERDWTINNCQIYFKR